MLLLLMLMALQRFTRLSTFSINGNPVFRNGPKSLPEHSPDCPILRNRVLDNFILAEKLFAKSLRSHETCVSANKNL